MSDTNSSIDTLKKELVALEQVKATFMRISQAYANDIKLTKKQLAKYTLRFVTDQYAMYILTNQNHYLVCTREVYENKIKMLREKIAELSAHIEMLSDKSNK